MRKQIARWKKYNASADRIAEMVNDSLIDVNGEIWFDLKFPWYEFWIVNDDLLSDLEAHEVVMKKIADIHLQCSEPVIE